MNSAFQLLAFATASNAMLLSSDLLNDGSEGWKDPQDYFEAHDVVEA